MKDCTYQRFKRTKSWKKLDLNEELAEFGAASSLELEFNLVFLTTSSASEIEAIRAEAERFEKIETKWIKIHWILLLPLWKN
jgi:hypothetical protein